MKHCPFEVKISIIFCLLSFSTAGLVALPSLDAQTLASDGVGSVELLDLVAKFEEELTTLDGEFRPNRRALLARLAAIQRRIEELPRDGERQGLLTRLYQLEDVKLDPSVLVLPRYNNNPFGGHFLLENRQDNDPLGPLYDTEINDDGIAVGHIVEDPAENLKMPRGASIAD